MDRYTCWPICLCMRTFIVFFLGIVRMLNVCLSTCLSVCVPQRFLVICSVALSHSSCPTLRGSIASHYSRNLSVSHAAAHLVSFRESSSCAPVKLMCLGSNLQKNLHGIAHDHLPDIITPHKPAWPLHSQHFNLILHKFLPKGEFSPSWPLFTFRTMETCRVKQYLTWQNPIWRDAKMTYRYQCLRLDGNTEPFLIQHVNEFDWWQDSNCWVIVIPSPFID